MPKDSAMELRRAADLVVCCDLKAICALVGGSLTDAGDWRDAVVATLRARADALDPPDTLERVVADMQSLGHFEKVEDRPGRLWGVDVVEEKYVLRLMSLA